MVTHSLADLVVQGKVCHEGTGCVPVFTRLREGSQLCLCVRVCIPGGVGTGAWVEGRCVTGGPLYTGFSKASRGEDILGNPRSSCMPLSSSSCDTGTISSGTCCGWNPLSQTLWHGGEVAMVKPLSEGLLVPFGVFCVHAILAAV